MARYIECEAACAEVDKGDLLIGNNAEFAKEIINRTPAADVVPKSEFDRVATELARVEELYFKKSGEVERLKAQNETLDILVKDLRCRNKAFQRANEMYAKRCEELNAELNYIGEKENESTIKK